MKLSVPLPPMFGLGLIFGWEGLESFVVVVDAVPRPRESEWRLRIYPRPEHGGADLGAWFPVCRRRQPVPCDSASIR